MSTLQTHYFNYQETLARRQQLYAASQALDGLQEQFIIANLKKYYPNTWSKFRVSNIQLLTKITKKKSRAYSTTPKRILTDPKKTSFIEKIYNKNYFIQALKDFDYSFNYFGFGLLYLKFLGVRNNFPEFRLVFIPPYQYDIEFDQETGEVKTILIQTQKNQNSVRYSLWETNRYIDFFIGKYDTRINVNLVSQNPLGVAPFIFLKKDTQPSFPVLNNLFSQSVAWNTALSDLHTAAIAQGHGQLIIYYHPNQKPPNLEVGMHTAICIPRPPEDSNISPTQAQYIGANPKLAEQLEVLKFTLQMILEDNDIKGKNVVSTSQESFSSGFDRLLSEADVQFIINDNQTLYADLLEKKLFEVVKKFLKLNRINFLSDDDQIEVYFEKPKVLITDREIFENIAMQLKLGLLKPYEKHMIINPNLTIDEAISRENEIRKDLVEEAAWKNKISLLNTGIKQKMNGSNSIQNSLQNQNNSIIKLDNILNG